MTVENAKQYKEKLDEKVPQFPNSGVHINSILIETKKSKTRVLNWQRKDCRVSKEQFTAKYQNNSEKIIVERSEVDRKVKWKAEIYLNTVLGAQTNENNIILETCKPPEVLKKEDKSEWQIGMNFSLPDVCTMRIHMTSMKAQDISTISKLPRIQSALQSGIKDDYTPLALEEENPHHSFPIVKDPTLVKSAQLAINSLLNEDNLPSIIRKYQKLKFAFDKLLRVRLSILKKNEE